MAHKKGYIFTNKKHPVKAIMSVILGALSNASVAAAVFLAYRRGGEALGSYGAAALLAAVFSLIGLLLGMETARQKDIYKLFPLLGIVLNLLALAVIGFILYMGFSL